ncbi:MAG: MoaD/ThiS family protein [Candidatus Caldarchaeales archaeon]
MRLVLPSIIAGGGDKVREIEASTLKDIVEYLCNLKPEVRDRIISPDGELNRSFNFYVNGVNAYFIKGVDTELKDGDEVSVIPALGGG